MCWSNYFFSLKWEALQHLFSLITSVIAQDVFQAMNTLIIGQVLSFGDQRQQHWQVLIDRWSVIIRCVDETFDGREVQVFRLWPQAHLQEMRSLLHNRRYHAIRLYSCLIWIKKYAKERGNKALEIQKSKQGLWDIFRKAITYLCWVSVFSTIDFSATERVSSSRTLPARFSAR